MIFAVVAVGPQLGLVHLAALLQWHLAAQLEDEVVLLLALPLLLMLLQPRRGLVQLVLLLHRLMVSLVSIAKSQLDIARNFKIFVHLQICSQ